MVLPLPFSSLAKYSTSRTHAPSPGGRAADVAWRGTYGGVVRVRGVGVAFPCRTCPPVGAEAVVTWLAWPVMRACLATHPWLSGQDRALEGLCKPWNFQSHIRQPAVGRNRKKTTAFSFLGVGTSFVWLNFCTGFAWHLRTVCHFGSRLDTLVWNWHSASSHHPKLSVAHQMILVVVRTLFLVHYVTLKAKYYASGTVHEVAPLLCS